jgi:hypothetical protein
LADRDNLVAVPDEAVDDGQCEALGGDEVAERILPWLQIAWSTWTAAGGAVLRGRVTSSDTTDVPPRAPSRTGPVEPMRT